MSFKRKYPISNFSDKLCRNYLLYLRVLSSIKKTVDLILDNKIKLWFQALSFKDIDIDWKGFINYILVSHPAEDKGRGHNPEV